MIWLWILEKTSLDLFRATEASRSVALKEHPHFSDHQKVHINVWTYPLQRTKGEFYRAHLIVADLKDSIWPCLKKEREREKAKKEESWINKITLSNCKTVPDWWMQCIDSVCVCVCVCVWYLTYPERNIKYPKFIYKLCSFVTCHKVSLVSLNLLKVLKERKLKGTTDVCSFQFAGCYLTHTWF